MLWRSLASTAILLTTLYSATLTGAQCSCPSTSETSSSTTSATSNTSAPTSSSTSSPSNNTTGASSKSTSNGSTNGTSSSGPQFFIYSDKWVTNSLPDVADVKGYTVFALSFLLSTGAADQAQGWAQLDSSTRKSLKSKYNEAGIKVVVSAFGGTETPTTSGVDAATAANTMAKWVIDNDLDGIDVDYEDFAAMNLGDGKAEEWLSTFTKTLRSRLPRGQYIITHAPVAPWFSTSGYKSGAYLTVHKNVGDMIDWYNIQFYNQNEYTNCTGLINKSSTTWPGTSLREIAQSGVEQSKLIVGKPATTADASNGYIDPATLATCLKQAKDEGWTGGVMVWQYPNADAKWIETVRSQSWPVGS